MSAPASFEQQLATFLAWLDEPYAGLAIHRALAPDAPIAFKFDVVPARELDAQAFALGFAAASLMAEGTARRPRLGPAALTALVEEGEHRRVAWFRATEEGGTPVHLAAGFEAGPGGWRLGWLTLAEAPADWGYDLGRAQTVADWAYAVPANMPVPRSWLDLAWYRLHGRPTPALTALPDARFACQGSGHCCDRGFAITVPLGAQALVDAIPWEAVAPGLRGTRLEPVDALTARLKGADEACRFLDDRKRCLLHATLGRQPFPICATYPVLFAATPDGVDVALSHTCGSARAGLGPPLAERAEDLWGRLALRGAAPAAVPPLAAGVAAPWAAYRACETAVLAALAPADAPADASAGRADVPLARRLLHASALIDAAVAGGPPPAAPPPAPAPLEDPGPRDAVLRRFAAHLGLPEGPAPGLSAADEAALAEAFRNGLFAKHTAARHGLRAAHHLHVLAFAAARRAGAALALKPFVSGLSHGALDAAIDALADLRALVETPGFAAWVLAPEG